MISIVVSWCDRVELRLALPGLIASAQALGGDVTVVNYGGTPDLLEAQVAGFTSDLRIVDVPPQTYFNKARAQNLGAAHTSHPLLFFCDCDILIEPDTLAGLVDRVDGAPGHFATLAGVTETETNARGGGHVTCFGYELLIRTADGRELRIVDNEEDAEDGTRQAPGLLVVHRSDFLAVDGYNSQLHGWGWEDQDMIARLTLGGGCTRIIDGHVLHVSHDDEARVARYPISDRWESRDKMFRQALANYDDANFRGTYPADVEHVPASLRTAVPS